MPFYTKNDSGKSEINLITNRFNIKSDNFNFLVDSDIDLSGSFENPVLGGDLSLNNGFINFNSTNQSNKIVNNKPKEDKNWPELYWNKMRALK